VSSLRIVVFGFRLRALIIFRSAPVSNKSVASLRSSSADILIVGVYNDSSGFSFVILTVLNLCSLSFLPDETRLVPPDARSTVSGGFASFPTCYYRYYTCYCILFSSSSRSSVLTFYNNGKICYYTYRCSYRLLWHNVVDRVNYDSLYLCCLFPTPNVCPSLCIGYLFFHLPFVFSGYFYCLGEQVGQQQTVGVL